MLSGCTVLIVGLEQSDYIPFALPFFVPRLSVVEVYFLLDDAVFDLLGENR